ncbi:MAG: MFS transporter, partial [Pseudomonadota bacterium]
FSSRRFWGYTFAAAFASGAFFAFLGGSPFVATNAYGLSETMAGVGFGAPAVGYATGNFLAGRFSTRLGFNRMILLGGISTTIGMIALTILALLGSDNAVIFFALCTTIGLGNGMTIPNATAGMMSVRPELAGTASGIGGAIMIGGGAALSATAGLFLERFGGVTPLALVMLTSSILGVVSILYVIQREKVIARS